MNSCLEKRFTLSKLQISTVDVHFVDISGARLNKPLSNIFTKSMDKYLKLFC